MTQQMTTEAGLLPLDDIRVLDLSGLIGQYATRLLADLGADVIRVEPPAGSETRRHLPFYHNEPDLDRGLTFWYFNANKRSISLNLQTADGRALFERLLATADVVVDGHEPGIRSSPSSPVLDGAPWRRRFPRLIWADLSGFGSSGPHSAYASTDLVALAMSGVLTLSGYPDRPPVMLPGEQAYLCASIQAVQGVLMALFARDRDGLGQVVEVSVQEALSMAQETAMQTWDLRHEVRRRTGASNRMPGVGTYQCADGYVYCMVSSTGAGAPWSVLLAWMNEEGMAGDLLQDSWPAVIDQMNLQRPAALEDNPSQLRRLMEDWRHVDAVLRAFLLRHTKAELYEGGQRRRLLIGSVNSAKDLLEDRQLRARGWYSAVTQPDIDEPVVYPGPPYRFAAFNWAIRRPPPRLGEHNAEVYQQELGLTTEQLTILAGVGAI